MRGVDAEGGLCGAKRRHKKQLRATLEGVSWEVRGVGNWERESRSTIRKDMVLYNKESEFWDRDGRRPGRQMTSCVRQRCWYKDS